MDEAAQPILVNKAQQVARLLLDRILQHDLHSGSSFGTEAELIEHYQVSRPTLRESLRILESQGVLSLRPGPKGGIMVSKPSIDVLAHLLSVFLRLHDVPLEEILRARMAIEPALARDAALHGTEHDFEDMAQSIERMAAAHDDGQTIYSENREFHNIIARAAGNPVLEIFWLTIRSLASGEGEKMKFTQRNRDHIVTSHREILNACRAGDVAVAQGLMRDHLGELELLLRKRSLERQKERQPIDFEKAGRRR
jgi:DNA-binding FadR family transcriptional regulator